ncbi:MAG: imidazoleglycerol-phosphate dehydratase, partial [Metallosphaera sp.]
MSRYAERTRETKETLVEVKLEIDGNGEVKIDTP